MIKEETITPLPQSEHFLIGSKAAINLKYVHYISYKISSTYTFAYEISAVTSEGKVILDIGLNHDETREKFKSYLKQIELMTTMNYIIKEEKK